VKKFNQKLPAKRQTTSKTCLSNAVKLPDLRSALRSVWRRIKLSIADTSRFDAVTRMSDRRDIIEMRRRRDAAEWVVSVSERQIDRRVPASAVTIRRRLLSIGHNCMMK